MSLVQSFPKTQKNTTQLLQFSYLIENKTYDPYLLDINCNVKLSNTGLLYGDAVMYWLLDKILTKMESKILEFKYNTKAQEKIDKIHKR